MTELDRVYAILGPPLILAIFIIGFRLLSYWHSFIFHHESYRIGWDVTTEYLVGLPLPNLKIQITTQGSIGSSEVIARGIQNVKQLVDEAPGFYGDLISVEIVTESEVQAVAFRELYEHTPLEVSALVVPASYRTANGTGLKARALHYTVEARRMGWNVKGNRTFVVHYDEESVMLPAELRRLLAVLYRTEKKILEGPIYYPLEYLNTSILCRSMEANRPVGCFECRHVMESGVPLHLHGSNLVVEEEFENSLGWDIGALDGEPCLAEDYIFGVNAYLAEGSEVFGWHGCLMLEQPPFTLRSAFRQRHRWIFGVLQGLKLTQTQATFAALPRRNRIQLRWGARFRIATFALGSLVGVISLMLMPLLVFREVRSLVHGAPTPLPSPIVFGCAVVGFFWLGAVFIGAWCNVAYSDLTGARRWREIAMAILVAPVAGLLESSAAFWAVIEWNIGRREVKWKPTPKTRLAEGAARHVDHPLGVRAVR